jgi:hypothetical protein
VVILVKNIACYFEIVFTNGHKPKEQILTIIAQKLIDCNYDFLQINNINDLNDIYRGTFKIINNEFSLILNKNLVKDMEKIPYETPVPQLLILTENGCKAKQTKTGITRNWSQTGICEWNPPLSNGLLPPLFINHLYFLFFRYL